MKLACDYLDTCRGCSIAAFDWDQQKKIKIDKLTRGLESQLSPRFLSHYEISSLFPVFDYYRTRCDFTYYAGRLGWYDRDQQFLPIESCPLQIPELTKFAQFVGQLDWPIDKGSMRFRVAPDGQRGLWLDLANIDIKKVLDSGVILNQLLDQNIIVEMGQKGKRVRRIEASLKLVDPTGYPWFTSYFKSQPVPLRTLISSFTQTNPDLNVQMIQKIKSFIDGQCYEEIIEFGGGVGNFTLFLSEVSNQVTVIENDFRNLISLRENLKVHHLSEKVKIIENVNRFVKTENGFARRLYFVNPARSGVGVLFDRPMPASEILYVSCYMESFLSDIKKLDNQGFVLKSIALFDQFPNSNHFEILAKIVKSDV